MKKLFWVLIVLVVLAAIGFVVFKFWPKAKPSANQPATLDSSWVTAQPTEMVFYRSIKGGEIKLLSPQIGQKVKSPLTITGEAKGSWSFEGTFPVVLENAERKAIVEGQAKIEGEWMTDDYRPFSATLEFANQTGKGYLVFKKANASGMTSKDDLIEIPISF